MTTRSARPIPPAQVVLKQAALEKHASTQVPQLTETWEGFGMRSVVIECHVVRDATADLPLPQEDLRSLYRSTGLDLTFSEGEAISADPAFSALQSYDDLLLKLRNPASETGHLIVGLRPPPTKHGICGELLDLEARSVAVVYTQSDYIQREGRSAFLQTCAHELGHMLNLAHSRVGPAYVSVMNQAQDRSNAVASVAWASAVDEARTIVASGRAAYFEAPTRELSCFPFSQSARCFLNTSMPSRVMPGQSPFEESFDGANDSGQ